MTALQAVEIKDYITMVVHFNHSNCGLISASLFLKCLLGFFGTFSGSVPKQPCHDQLSFLVRQLIKFEVDRCTIVVVYHEHTDMHLL